MKAHKKRTLYVIISHAPEDDRMFTYHIDEPACVIITLLDLSFLFVVSCDFMLFPICGFLWFFCFPFVMSCDTLLFPICGALWFLVASYLKAMMWKWEK